MEIGMYNVYVYKNYVQKDEFVTALLIAIIK